MKKFALLLSFLLVCNLCVSQTKVTDFAGTKAVAPLNVKKIGVLDNQLIFTANTSDRNGIWATDGTKESTRLLETDPLSDVSFCNERSFKFQQDGVLYATDCANNRVFRIDGASVEVLPTHYPLLIQEITGFKNYVYVRSGFLTGTGIGMTLTKLLASGKTIDVKSGLRAVEFTTAGFFYITADNVAKTNALFFDDGNAVSKVTDVSGENVLSTRLNVTVVGDKALIISDKRATPVAQLIVYDLKNKKVLTTEDWSKSNPLAEQFFAGENGKTYIVNGKNPVRNEFGAFVFDLHLLLPNDSTKVVRTFFNAELTPVNTTGFAKRVTPIYVTERALIYTVADLAGSGITGRFILARFDFVEGRLTESEDLGDKLFVDFDNQLTLERVSQAGFTFRDTNGTKLTYNFDNREIIEIDDSETVTDSTLKVNDKKLLVSNNIYRLEGNAKIPLIDAEEVFSKNDRSVFFTKEVNGKLLLFKSSIDPLNPGLELQSISTANKTEKLLTIADEILWGDCLYVPPSIGAKAYFLTRSTVAGKPTDTYSVYASDGTKQNTTKIGSFVSDEFKVEKIHANSSQLIFLKFMTFDRKSELLIIENSKFVTLPIPEKSYSIYQTTDNFYYAVNIKDGVFHDIYYLKDNRFELIAENTNGQRVVGNALFYTKFKDDYISGLGTLVHQGDKEKQVDANVSGIIETVGNLVVLQNGAYILVYDSSSGKEITRYEQPKDVRVDAKIINGALVFVEPAKVTVITGGSRKTIELDKSFRSSAVTPVANGFLILSAPNANASSYRTINYYNLRTDELRKIENPASTELEFVNKPGDYTILYESPPNRDFRVGKFTFWFWDESMNAIERFSFDNLNSYFVKSSGRVVVEEAIGGPFKNRVWYHSPGKFESVGVSETEFIQFYERAGKAPVVYSNNNRSIFFGSVVRQYTKDEVVQFPAINADKGGASVYSVFPFQDKVYAYAFTYADGWQVWNLGKFIEEEANYLGKVPLANEEISLQVNVFPNPTTEGITISAEKPVGISLFSITGQLISTHEPKQFHQIAIGDLPTGMYLLEINDGKLRTVKKVVKF